MAAAEGRARRLMALLRGHPACDWPVATTVVMGLHGLTDALCAPKKANQVWTSVLRNVRRWSAEDERWRTQSEEFARSVMKPRKWVFFLFPGVDHSAPPAVDPREMAFFLRCLDPIMHSDSGAVLSSCIASGDATTLQEVAIAEAFITNSRHRPGTVAVLRVDPTTSSTYDNQLRRGGIP